jgi:hypothetical protein
MTGSVTPGLVETVEPATASEPLLGAVLFVGFVVGRELLDDSRSADA